MCIRDRLYCAQRREKYGTQTNRTAFKTRRGGRGRRNSLCILRLPPSGAGTRQRASPRAPGTVCRRHGTPLPCRAVFLLPHLHGDRPQPFVLPRQRAADEARRPPADAGDAPLAGGSAGHPPGVRAELCRAHVGAPLPAHHRRAGAVSYTHLGARRADGDVLAAQIFHGLDFGVAGHQLHGLVVEGRQRGEAGNGSAFILLKAMDEFDKFGAQKMPLLKNLMQMSSLNICKAYQKNFRSLPRIASFIGTSNRTDLLCDPTGSRRFICIEAEHDIDCTGIEHSQIYAQLKEELLAGARHWFNKEEEHALQRHNSAYYHVNPIEDIVCNIYAPAMLDEPDCLSLSAAIIHQELKKRFPAVLRNCTPIQLAQILTATGISRQHTRLGNVYLVKKVKGCEE